MTQHHSPSLDAAAIRELVEEVLRRIEAGDTRPAPSPEAGATTPPADVARPTAATQRIDAAVVTLAHIERLPAGTRSVAVAARAVVTPSARDRAREAGIAIVRAAASAATGGVPAAGPFVIAQADVRGPAAAHAAGIARSVPRAQRLPATGLTDVIAALALHASRDAARGILLTSRPATALILANRSASLRAVTGRDARSLAAAAAESAANLLVVDPTVVTGGLERLCADFAARVGGPVPAELGQVPAGCGCKGHSHGSASP